MHPLPATPEERAGLLATFERLRNPHWNLTFEQAIAWPAMLIVLRCAGKSFDAQRQNIDHTAERARENAWRLAPPAPAHAHVKKARKRKGAAKAEPAPRRPDVKQRQANDMDMFEEAST